MSIDSTTVARVAKLARIRVEEQDLEPLAGELRQIVGFVEQLNAVPTDGVEPMTSVAHMKLPMREDVVTDGDRVTDILKNGPDATTEFFTVPKVVE